ncbi:MAG: helicase HerA domain-containing protein [Promethearchaeota archaeon]
MSNQDSSNQERIPVGRLTGKTTSHTVNVIITDPNIGRNNYFVIFGAPDDNGIPQSYMLSIMEMWSEEKGFIAKLQVLGERPERPFERGAEVYLATEEQIKKVLGINNPPEQSIAIGNLLGYPFDVYLLVKNFGRIFITGKSGSGKSYTMGVLCEEFLKKGIPIVIIDRHGEYASLKIAAEDINVEGEEMEEIVHCPFCGQDMLESDVICQNCGKNIMVEIPTEFILEEGEDSDKAKVKPPKKETLNESEFIDKIIEFADLKKNRGADIDIEHIFSLEPSDIVSPNLCTIVNLRGMSLEVQEIIAGRLLKRLYEASTSRKIPPFYLFLDEAHLFAGKKQTETCEIVKLFAQEGRKFGANIVIGTQRPQLLDTTIRAQSGSWIVHNLSDVRDIGITIQSAEDLSKEYKNDISGLDKGQAIICGEAVSGIPLFVQVRSRKTKHGGTGFNVLDFLSESTVEELQKRKERILGKKSEEELETGKTMFQEIIGPKSVNDYLEEIRELKIKNKELEIALEKCREGVSEETISPNSNLHQKVKDLEVEVNVWREKYNFLKKASESEKITQKEEIERDNEENIAELNDRILLLENEIKNWKSKYEEAIRLAEKSIAELKKSKK